MQEEVIRHSLFWNNVSDPAVEAFRFSIRFWDDGEDIYLLPERASQLEVSLANRWIAFLEGNAEYDWPKADLVRPLERSRNFIATFVALPIIFILVPVIVLFVLLMAIICLPYRLFKKRWPGFTSNEKAVMFSDQGKFEAYLRKRMGKMRSRDLDLTNWPFHGATDTRSQEMRA
jgi:hypothetical protein